jgi:hypothetical protein
MMGWVGMILAVLKNVNRFRNSFADSSFADAIKHTIREPHTAIYGANKFCFSKLRTAVSMLEVAWSRVTS